MPKSMSLSTGLPPDERDEDVLRLEVAVDDAERVRGLERLEDLQRVLAGRGHGERRWRSSMLESGSPSSSSITMYAWPSGVRSTSVTCTTCALLICAATRASCRKRSTRPVRRASSGCRTLMATRVPSTVVLRLVDRAHPAVAEEAQELVLAVDDLPIWIKGLSWLASAKQLSRSREATRSLQERETRVRSRPAPAACERRICPTVSASAMAAKTGRSVSSRSLRAEGAARRHRARLRAVEHEEHVVELAPGGVDHVRDARPVERELLVAATDEHARVGDEVARGVREAHRPDEARVGHGQRTREQEEHAPSARAADEQRRERRRQAREGAGRA